MHNAKNRFILQLYFYTDKDKRIVLQLKIINQVLEL